MLKLLFLVPISLIINLLLINIKQIQNLLLCFPLLLIFKNNTYKTITITIEKVFNIITYVSKNILPGG